MKRQEIVLKCVLLGKELENAFLVIKQIQSDYYLDIRIGRKKYQLKYKIYKNIIILQPTINLCAN